MKVIGGFFELLLPENSFEYHNEASALSNGRACLRVILKNINIKNCYLPNYTCDAIYEPFKLECISYRLYNIDGKLDPIDLPELQTGEYFYYINYYGIKSKTVQKLYRKYGSRLIVDNTHDFFKKRVFNCWSYTTARKYFGVPDGAFLYSPEKLYTENPRFINYQLEHSVERLKGNQIKAFESYQMYEKSLTSEIYFISKVSEKLLTLVNLEKNIKSRVENFNFIHSKIKHLNKLEIEVLEKGDTPFCYPFLPVKNIEKSTLYKKNIFIPNLWSDPLSREITNISEQQLAKNLLPLPIDDRYDLKDMDFMVKTLLECLK